jgi:hypothetical protein
MNRRTSDSRGDSIPYESYYGVSSVRSFENTFGNISGNVETEVGLKFAEKILVDLKNNHPKILLRDDEVAQLMKLGDELCYCKEKLETREERDLFDLDTKLDSLTKEFVEKLVEATKEKELREASKNCDGDKCDSEGNKCDIEETDQDSTILNKKRDLNEFNKDLDNDEERKPAAKKVINFEQFPEDFKTPLISNKVGNTTEEQSVDEESVIDPQLERLQMKETNRILAITGQKKKQADKVNASRGKNFKEHLEVGDICLIRIEGNTRAATDKSVIIVMVTRIHLYRSRTNGSVIRKYEVCTKMVI